MINTQNLNQAKELRLSGYTYPEIRKLLNIDSSKSTMAYWFRDLKLSDSAQKRINDINNKNLDSARAKALVVNKEKREKYLLKIQKRNLRYGRLTDENTLKVALAMLYLGEGSKWAGHRGLSLGSSSPSIILLYINLLKLCYNLDPSSLKCRVQPRADQNIKELNQFWSSITGIPIDNFYKTKADVRTIGKTTKRNNYKGVCVISGGGTEVQIELETIAEIFSRGISSVG